MRERPARTPPSTFLFLPIHFSNSPGIMATPTLRWTGEPSKPVHPNTIGYRFTIPVRSFKGAQSRRKRTTRREDVYRLRCGELSTGISQECWPLFLTSSLPSRPRAAPLPRSGTGFKGLLRRTEAIFLGRAQPVRIQGMESKAGASSHRALADHLVLWPAIDGL